MGVTTPPPPPPPPGRSALGDVAAELVAVVAAEVVLLPARAAWEWWARAVAMRKLGDCIRWRLRRGRPKGQPKWGWGGPTWGAPRYGTHTPPSPPPPNKMRPEGGRGKG